MGIALQCHNSSADDYSKRCKPVKYFFLAEGWTVGRVWELGGIWNEVAWRRKPEIHRMSLFIQEKEQKLWLHSVEDAVLMVEVRPLPSLSTDLNASTIGQVVLKRLISAEQVLELLCTGQLVAIGTEIEINVDVKN